MKRHLHHEESSEESMDEEEYKHDIAQLPVISFEGHYWLGKDYANTYKQDFKDIHEFSQGENLKYML